MECEFCHKIFSTKTVLLTHKKSAKYCLSLQGKENKDFQCQYCDRTFTLEHVLKEHLQSCKKKETEKYNESKLKFQEKEKELKEKHHDKEKELKEKHHDKEKELKEKLEDKEKELKEKLEDKEKELKEKLEDKNIQILWMNTRLEKYENAVIHNMLNSNKPIQKIDYIPVPLKEQISTIVIDEFEDEFDYNIVNHSMIEINNVLINNRRIDHYVNATQLCQAGEKNFKDWVILDITKELITELSNKVGITSSMIIDTTTKKDQVWIHPYLSIQLASWISPLFFIEISKWVITFFNKGTFEIDLNLLQLKDNEIRSKDNRIKHLEIVCLSKQSRVEYPQKNVIYLLTTEDHLKRRTYIIGKAKNLTTRLGTYNKTCDHKVVYYRECKSEDDMDMAETMVLGKLRDYKEQANRDRIILPEDKDISFFIGVINECIDFLK